MNTVHVCDNLHITCTLYNQNREQIVVRNKAPTLSLQLKLEMQYHLLVQNVQEQKIVAANSEVYLVKILEM